MGKRKSFDDLIAQDIRATLDFVRWRLAGGRAGVLLQEVVDFWRRRGGGSTYGRILVEELARAQQIEYAAGIILAAPGGPAPEEAGDGNA